MVSFTILWLALAPQNSLGLILPASIRHSQRIHPSQQLHLQRFYNRCHDRRKRRSLICMQSLYDDDTLTAADKMELNGEEHNIDIDPSNESEIIEDIIQEELEIDDEDEEFFESIEGDAVSMSSLSQSQRRKRKAPKKNSRMQMFQYLSQPIVEVRVIGLVILSCFLNAINTINDLPSGMHESLDMIDTICVYIFAVEFFLRWWSAGRFRLRYLKKPLVSIDAIVVVIPLILSGLLPLWNFGEMAGFLPYLNLPGWLVSTSTGANSALLNLRLLRVLKFQRVLTDENTYMNFEMALGMRKTDVRPYQLQLARVIISIFTLVSVSTGLIYTAEHEVNPDIPDYFTALYFGLTTLTTVGFGDITPVTSQGRLVVGGSILAGVAIIPAQAASLAEAYLEFQKERPVGKRKPSSVIAEPNNNMAIGKEKCKNCGSGPHRNDAIFCWSCGETLD